MRDYGKRQTEAWRLYELGKQYNNSLSPNYYNLVDTNVEFFIGNQWKGLANNSAMASLPKPVFNIIKRICSLFVASLTSSSSMITFEPLANKQEAATVGGDLTEGQKQVVQDEDAEAAATMATSEVSNLLEKFKMDFRIRDALFDGVQTGDYCAHFFWDANARPYGGAYGAYRGEIRMEMVDGVNIMFGNPNTAVVEAQPYILVIGRDTVDNLRREYLQYHPTEKSAAESCILPDKNYMWQAGSGGKIELGDDDKTGKALFIYYYTKKIKEVELSNPDGTPRMENVLDAEGRPVQAKTKDGLPMIDVNGQPVYKQKRATELRSTVHVSKHCQFVDIFDEVDTGLTYYPIAWGNWERQKNCYHGRALVTGIIPNQIYINSMFALIMRHQQMLGFPKTLYDANVIGQWNNAVGQAIPVYDLPPDKRMSDLHSVIQPADMSTQIMRCIEMAVQYTKECLGATDAQLGNVKPDNTSALIALQSSSQVPLENPQANKYEWVEDIGRILLDMMGTYYGKRPVVRHDTVSEQSTDPQTGMPLSVDKPVKVVEMYDFNKLKDLWLNIRADVGASTYWSRIAVVQTLDNLKQNGIIDVLDYLERMPDEYIPRKAELISKLRKTLTDEQQQQAAKVARMQQEGGPELPDTDTTTEGVGAAMQQDSNKAALIASLPTFGQEQYQNYGKRVKNALLKQAAMTTVGS